MKKVGIVVIAFVVFLLTGCGGTDYEKLEKDFVAKASKYYEDNIKDNVLNINQHQITLDALQNSGVDVTALTDEECDTASYVLIKLELDDEGKQKGDYETEVHLTCNDYKSENK